jgi:hypothetical protein
VTEKMAESLISSHSRTLAAKVGLIEELKAMDEKPRRDFEELDLNLARRIFATP